jgi:hypothetical protein
MDVVFKELLKAYREPKVKNKTKILNSRDGGATKTLVGIEFC